MNEKRVDSRYSDVEKNPSIQNTEIQQDAHGHLVMSDGEDTFTDERAQSLGNKNLVKRYDLRILPLSAFIYFLCYLDRSNIGNAKIMNQEEGNSLMQQARLTEYQYTIALMIFLIAYGLFEVPSNYFLKKLSPSKWIAFIMFAWGAITVGLGGVRSYASLTVVRFLLGVVEAGLFPGLVYYLCFWYRTNERSLRVAIILASATLAGAFGGAIAYGVSFMDNIGNLSAFRWLFVLEGIPSCLCSILVWFLMPDYPETAGWLSKDEKALAAERLAFNGSRGNDKALTWEEAKDALLDWRLYIHYVAYFGISVPFSSLSLFTPSITAGLGFTSIRAQLMTVPPYAAAYVVTLLVSYSADRTNRRALHAIALAFIGAIGFIASATLSPIAYAHRYGCLILAACGSFASIPPLLGWLSSNMHTTGATGLAIALNIGLGGAPGQIVGVWIYKADEKASGYPTGHWTNAALLLVTCVCCGGLMGLYDMRNRRIRSGAVPAQPLWRL